MQRLQPLQNGQFRSKINNAKNMQGYSPCKGYSLCKMISLGQKLKITKTCVKSFYENSRVVLCKKPLEKTPHI